MSIGLSLTHATVTTAFIFATSDLGAETGNMGNAFFNIATILASLFLAIPSIKALGLRLALMLGMGCLFAYIVFFFIACSSPHFKSVLYCAGSCIGGLGAGLVWTVQGAWFSHSAKSCAGSDEAANASASAKLAGVFAFWFLLCESLEKILWSVLLYANATLLQIGLVFACTSFAGLLVVIVLVNDLCVDIKGDTCTTFLDTIRLWPNVRLWLISLTSVTFGFSIAFMNGDFNVFVAKPALGTASIGPLTVSTVIAAFVFSQAYTYLEERLGTVAVLTIGAVSFGSIALIGTWDASGASRWGWWLVVFYLLQGSGRAVYESINKAVYSRFFVGAETEPAFANCYVLTNASTALGFALATHYSASVIAACALTTAVLTPIGYVIACRMALPDTDGEKTQLFPKPVV